MTLIALHECHQLITGIIDSDIDPTSKLDALNKIYQEIYLDKDLSLSEVRLAMLRIESLTVIKPRQS